MLRGCFHLLITNSLFLFAFNFVQMSLFTLIFILLFCYHYIQLKYHHIFLCCCVLFFYEIFDIRKEKKLHLQKTNAVETDFILVWPNLGLFKDHLFRIITSIVFCTYGPGTGVKLNFCTDRSQRKNKIINSKNELKGI
jgi:hypothetical protein